jgi:RNA polymerase sigma factor (sigma-70 family)
MAQAQATRSLAPLLYHFCRLRLPELALPFAHFEEHLRRAFAMFQAKQQRAPSPEANGAVTWPGFLENLYGLDFFLACACLEGQPRAWEVLWSARANKTDTLLVDALRRRAVRLFPRDEARQEEEVNDFWSFLLVGDREAAPPKLASYDGQRPLVPWLITVFHNALLTKLRQDGHLQPLPDDVHEPSLPAADTGDERWHHEFRAAAHEWFASLSDEEVLLLGLRLRYRMSQRDVAGRLGIHEGNITRRVQRLRDRCLETIGENLRALGWTGDDLTDFVLKEMEDVLLDEPRLSADNLARLLAPHTKQG